MMQFMLYEIYRYNRSQKDDVNLASFEAFTGNFLMETRGTQDRNNSIKKEL